MQSSYLQNNYDEVFYTIVTAFKPVIAVELGVLHGYSTIAIARALQKNRETGDGHCTLDAYDLFEDYPYNNGTVQEVQDGLLKNGLGDFVKLHKGDAFQAYKKYEDGSVYLLHIDLSNTGETLREMVEAWHKKMIMGGMILFEGGSEERDQVEWMIKYGKEPIKPELESNKIINADYVYATYLKFPSLTVMLKKRDDCE